MDLCLLQTQTIFKIEYREKWREVHLFALDLINNAGSIFVTLSLIFLAAGDH